MVQWLLNECSPVTSVSIFYFFNLPIFVICWTESSLNSSICNVRELERSFSAKQRFVSQGWFYSVHWLQTKERSKEICYWAHLGSAKGKKRALILHWKHTERTIGETVLLPKMCPWVVCSCRQIWSLMMLKQSVTGSGCEIALSVKMASTRIIVMFQKMIILSLIKIVFAIRTK